MPSMFRPTLLLAAFCTSTFVFAETNDTATTLPSVKVTAPNESITSPGGDTARQNIEQTPGGVDVIDSDHWRDTQAATIKDILDYSPGVFAQPKWGEDTRLSIRGSGLSRNFHMRGVQLYQDGVPLNTADGSGDFQEIDPSGYRYTEVYKGANALRFGANSLGGAINFVTPTGYNADALSARLDGGSFGYRRIQMSGSTVNGKSDSFITGSHQVQDGYRDHSAGENNRMFANTGYRFSDNLETRFYINFTNVTQEIPGSLSKDDALNNPTDAQANNVALDYQRNVESIRLANKTSWRHDNTLYEFGIFGMSKELIHPIFRYLDYQYTDQGGFVRATHSALLGDLANRFTVGATLHNGESDSQQFTNLPGGNKGPLQVKTLDSSRNTILYAENTLSVTPEIDLIAGFQYVESRREREDRLNPTGPANGQANYYFNNPKVGILWHINSQHQIFANISQSGEAPTFGELNFTNAALDELAPQSATTFEIGGRGHTNALNWALSLYRAELNNEFQYFDLGGGNYSVFNADDTVHQGVELGLGWRFWDGVFFGENNDSLEWNLAYTFNDFHFDNDASWGDNALPGAPPQYLRAEVLYRVHGFFAGPNTEWVPEGYYADNANTLKTNSYALMSLRAGYEHALYSIYVDARNITDKAYIASVTAQATANQALFEPGTGRAIFAGIQFKL